MYSGFWRQCSAHQMGSCNLVQLKAYRTVLDTTVSLPPHTECVVKVAELQSDEAKWEMPKPVVFEGKPCRLETPS